MRLLHGVHGNAVTKIEPIIIGEVTKHQQTEWNSAAKADRATDAGRAYFRVAHDVKI